MVNRIVAPPGRPAVDVLRVEIERNRPSPLSPVTVSAPHGAGLQLRRALARQGGLANVRFSPFTRIAELLGGPSLAAAGRTKTSPAVEAEAVRIALAQNPGRLAPWADHAGVLGGLRRTFADLRTAAPNAIESLARQTESRHLASIYTAYREKTARWYDDEALAIAAAAAIDGGEGAALKGLGRVILFQLHDMTEANRRLADRMGEHLEVTIIECASDVDRAHPAHIVIAPDAEQEMRAAARAIIEQATAGVPLYEMAVLFPQSRPYSRIAHETFTACGIPFNGSSPDTLAGSTLGKSLLYLIDLALQGFPARLMREWLSAAPVRASDSAGGEGGAQEFVRQLRAAELPPIATWSDYSVLSDGLLTDYLPEPVDADSGDARDADAVRRVLASIKMLDTMHGARPDLARFRWMMETLLAVPARRHGSLGKGVFIGSLHEARAMVFEYVWIVGGHEGSLLPAHQDDPFLPDWQRRLGGDGIPLREQASAQAAADYVSAAASAPQGRSVLSCPRAQRSNGAQCFVSRELVESANALNGAPVRSADLAHAARPWLTGIDSLEQGLLQPVLASLQEHDLADLLRVKSSGTPLAKSALALVEPAFARGLERETALASDAFTPWDGWLSDMGDNLRSIVEPTHAREATASVFETYAKCPYSYFTKHALNVRHTTPTDQLKAMEANEQGELRHRILERYANEALGPGSRQANLRSLTETALRIADEELSAAERTGPALIWRHTCKEIRAQVRAFVRANALFQAAHNLSVRASEVPFGGRSDRPAVHVDLDGTPVMLAGRIDRIDVDPTGGLFLFDYKPATFRKPPNGHDPVCGGTRLQPTLYSLAARQALGDGDSAALGSLPQFYYWPLNSGKCETFLSAVDVDAASGAIKTILDGIQKGQFPANPGKRDRDTFANCRTCDSGRICSADRDKAWSRKSLMTGMEALMSLQAPDLSQGVAND